MNRNDRAIVGLVMIAHGLVHTYELSIPIFITIWLTQFEVIDLGIAQFPVTRASLGFIVGAGYALFGLGALPGGILVDRVGSRRLIAACLLGMGGSFLLLGAAPNVVVVAVALLLWGFAASVYHPAGLALISKGITRRGTGFAYHGIAGNVGIGLGPFLTAVLLLFLDWTLVAGLLAVPALLATVYALRAEFDETAAVPDDRSADDDATTADAGTAADGGSETSTGVSSLSEFLAESRRLFAGSFALVFLVVMFSGLYYRGVLTFLPELLGDVLGIEPVPVAALLPDWLASSSDTGQSLELERYVYAGLLMVGVVGQYVGGKLTDRMRVERGIVGGFAGLAALAVLFLPVAGLGLIPLLAICAALGFFLFVVQPLYQATVAEYTPVGTRGLSYGFTYLGVFGVGALGSFIAGYLLDAFDAAALFATLAGFATVATLLGVYLSRRGKAAWA